jgi:hypothetical protein
MKVETPWLDAMASMRSQLLVSRAGPWAAVAHERLPAGLLAWPHVRLRCPCTCGIGEGMAMALVRGGKVLLLALVSCGWWHWPKC